MSPLNPIERGPKYYSKKSKTYARVEAVANYYVHYSRYRMSDDALISTKMYKTTKLKFRETYNVPPPKLTRARLDGIIRGVILRAVWWRKVHKRYPKNILDFY